MLCIATSTIPHIMHVHVHMIEIFLKTWLYLCFFFLLKYRYKAMSKCFYTCSRVVEVSEVIMTEQAPVLGIMGVVTVSA